ncbi:MAG: ParA family protein, partial [Armatimonadota bacterium]|nr:ParA family protein [Armatimonadota bacterium]
LTVNALTAATELLIPIQCEYYALEGLGQLMRSIELVRRHLNPGLEIGGVLLTMYDPRTNLSEQVAAEVRGYFGDKVFQTVIPRSVRLAEAPSHGQPITLYDPQSRGAQAYVALAQEVISRGRQPSTSF